METLWYSTRSVSRTKGGSILAAIHTRKRCTLFNEFGGPTRDTWRSKSRSLTPELIGNHGQRKKRLSSRRERKSWNSSATKTIGMPSTWSASEIDDQDSSARSPRSATSDSSRHATSGARTGGLLRSAMGVFGCSGERDEVAPRINLPL